MTKRLKRCTVTFSMDIREDDAEALLDAIRMLKYVAHVEVVATSLEDYFARNKVRYDCEARLHKAISVIMTGSAQTEA